VTGPPLAGAVGDPPGVFFAGISRLFCLAQPRRQTCGRSSRRCGKTDKVLFELPPVSSAADAANAAAALLEAVAVGDLTPAEASELGKLIEAYIKALEATDFAERLDKLERMTNR
jgi:hypothetical protein